MAVMGTRTCEVCGSEFGPRNDERPSVFARRKRCGFYCRPTNGDPDRRGRDRALHKFPPRPCEVCGVHPAGRGTVDRHHVNSDRLDNSPENIRFLCRKHHLEAHRMGDGKTGGGHRPRVCALMRDRAAAMAGEARAARAGGESVQSIAERYGVHPLSVYRWWRKYPEVTK